MKFSYIDVIINRGMTFYLLVLNVFSDQIFTANEKGGGVLTASDEKELLSQCKQGNRNAFNILVETYQSRVLNMAYGMLSNAEDANDAAQEVFIKIYRNIERFEEKSSLSTWIYRITVNVCNDMLRKRTRHAPTISLFSRGNNDDDEKPLEIKDNTPTPEERMEMTETQKEVRHALDELSDEFKTVITLYDLEGLSYDEISEILKCPVGTIKSRLNRARKALKKNLSEKRELFLK